MVVANKGTVPLIEMPEKPTRPLTPYFKFLKEHRPKLTDTGSTNNFQRSQDVVKEMAILWKNLDVNEKARYEQCYADEKVIKMLCFYLQNAYVGFLGNLLRKERKKLLISPT